jgi:hypothetical protein
MSNFWWVCDGFVMADPLAACPAAISPKPAASTSRSSKPSSCRPSAKCATGWARRLGLKPQIYLGKLEWAKGPKMGETIQGDGYAIGRLW